MLCYFLFGKTRENSWTYLGKSISFLHEFKHGMRSTSSNARNIFRQIKFFEFAKGNELFMILLLLHYVHVLVFKKEWQILKFYSQQTIELGAIIKIPGILQRPGTKIIDPNFVTKWGTSFHNIPNLLQDQFFWLKFFLFFLKHNILMGSTKLSTTLYYYVKGHETHTNDEPISQSILFFRH